MRPRTLDTSTYASNQGVVRVTREEYTRYTGRFGGGVPWHRFSEHFFHGDTNPAQIIDVEKGLVACYTDLDSQGGSRFHVVKIFVEKLGLMRHTKENGDRLAAISLYSRAPDSRVTGRWADFHPIVVDCVCTDPTVGEITKARIPDAHWEALEAGLTQLRGERKPGTYGIALVESLRARLG